MPGFLNKPLLRVHCFGFVFTPKLIPTVVLVFALIPLIYLGIWQLNRADQKKQIQVQFSSRPKPTPRTIAQLNQEAPESLAYYPVKLTGHYDNKHQFLVDNKIHNHRVGYDVLTPFIPDYAQKVLLVNRGWIPRGRDRQQLPALTPVEGQQTIQGLVKLPPKKTFVLGNQPDVKGWPLLVQSVNLQEIASIYHQPIYPFIVLLSPKNPNGYTREWKAIAVSSYKHLGYAVQWLALAATLVIIYLVINLRRERNGPSRKE